MVHFFADRGLTKEKTARTVHLYDGTIREYGKRQIITPGEEPGGVGILLAGTVLLENSNQDDQRRILDYYEAGDLLSKRCFPDNRHVDYYLITRTKCQVAFFPYNKVLEMLEKEDAQAEGAGGYLLLEAGRRALVHVDILGQRTLRQKLLTYFSYLNSQKGENSFALPFSLTDCADYLAADRSAMMRELGRMKAEGILEMDGRKVTLLRT